MSSCTRPSAGLRRPRHRQRRSLEIDIASSAPRKATESWQSSPRTQRRAEGELRSRAHGVCSAAGARRSSEELHELPEMKAASARWRRRDPEGLRAKEAVTAADFAGLALSQGTRPVSEHYCLDPASCVEETSAFGYEGAAPAGCAKRAQTSREEAAGEGNSLQIERSVTDVEKGRRHYTKMRGRSKWGSGLYALATFCFCGRGRRRRYVSSATRSGGEDKEEHHVRSRR